MLHLRARRSIWNTGREHTFVYVNRASAVGHRQAHGKRSKAGRAASELTGEARSAKRWTTEQPASKLGRGKTDGRVCDVRSGHQIASGGYGNLVVGRDITDRKRAEEALQQNEPAAALIVELPTIAILRRRTRDGTCF